jgi:hypothetical protein
VAKNSTKKKSRKNILPASVPAAPLPGRSVGVDVATLTEIVRGVVLEFAEQLPEQTDPQLIEAGRSRRGRQYAVRMRDRMKRFGSIYNAAWFVRHAENQEPDYRKQKMREFWEACRKELDGCRDIEAFTYAVADALTCYRMGYPWEG